MVMVQVYFVLSETLVVKCILCALLRATEDLPLLQQRRAYCFFRHVVMMLALVR